MLQFTHTYASESVQKYVYVPCLIFLQKRNTVHRKFNSNWCRVTIFTLVVWVGSLHICGWPTNIRLIQREGINTLHVSLKVSCCVARTVHPVVPWRMKMKLYSNPCIRLVRPLCVVPFAHASLVLSNIERTSTARSVIPCDPEILVLKRYTGIFSILSECSECIRIVITFCFVSGPRMFAILCIEHLSFPWTVTASSAICCGNCERRSSLICNSDIN